ncbi:hypothetical protein MUNTM_35590 [Mycobacterium sp. MUNTM1]
MANVERIVTHGTFELDGGSWEVDNNVWLVGDDSDIAVSTPRIPPRRSSRRSAGATWWRSPAPAATTTMSLSFPNSAKSLDAPVLLHPADDVLWRITHPIKNFELTRTSTIGSALRAGGSNCSVWVRGSLDFR